jgi:hypothetical protein
MITPRISVAPKTITKKRQASKRTTGDGPTNESIGILDDTIAKVLSSDENDPENVVIRFENFLNINLDV